MRIKPLGVALVGYGGSGRVHAKGYRDLPFHYGLSADSIRVVGVAAAHAQTAGQAARELGCPLHTDDYRQLLEREDVDLVDVCVPNALHEEIVVAAARAGKHVYCEKPLALNVAQARRMVAAARHAGIKGQMAFNYRFVPAVLRAKQLMDQGQVGRVFSFHGRYFRSSYIDPGKPLSWRLRRDMAGGGALFDLGSHLLDLIRFLLGKVASVRACLETPIRRRPVGAGKRAQGAVDVDDLALLQLRLEGGVPGAVEVSRLATGATNDLRLEIFGERGALRFNLENPNWLYFYDAHEPDLEPGGGRGFKRLETGQRYPGQRAPDWTAPLSFDRAHAECQYQFLRSIWEDRSPSPDLEDGLRVQEILEAAAHSAQLHNWVKLAG